MGKVTQSSGKSASPLAGEDDSPCQGEMAEGQRG